MTKFKFVLVALVLGITFFTHLYRIDKTFIFNNDEGRDALIAYRMIQTHQPILLGPETSVGNMYLGPFYYYLMVPALLLSRLDPVGPAIMVALFGILTTIGIIYLGKKWGNIWAGIIAGLIYALNPVMVHYSRSSWNPNIVPFISVLFLLNYQNKSKWSSLWFGILSGIMFQLHYVALVLPGLLFLQGSWQYLRVHEYGKFTKYLTAIVIGFLISSAPFWLFEVRHNFVNTRALGTYIATKSADSVTVYPKYFTRVIKNSETIIKGIIGSKAESQSNLSLPVALLALTILLIYSIKERNVLSYILFGSILISSLLKESIFVHYLAFLFPIICLIFGLAVTNKKWLSFATILLLLSLVVPTYKDLKYNLHEALSSQTVRAKNVADYIVKEAAARPYNVVNTQGSYATTIMYYLAISENPPKNDIQPLIFDICERALCPLDDETTTLLFLTGPSHPAIADYLGHPQINEFSGHRKIIKNEWVTYDIYIATVVR